MPFLSESDSSLESHTRLLNHIPGLVYRCSIEPQEGVENEKYQYTLTFVSKGAHDLLGIHAKDLMGKNSNVFESMMFEEDRALIRRQMYDSIVACRPYHIQYRLVLPSGETKWIWDQGEAVYGDDGIPHSLEGLLIDISEQKFQALALQEENRKLRNTVNNANGLGNIVGKSAGMRAVYSMILKAAQTDTNVIIYGETGCGKDLVARAIHEHSERKGAYIPVNCGAIPETLMESEFFGHLKGSFSGAFANKIGYIGAADQGTLFLDELGELPLHLQVKLLRSLENKMYTPVGGNAPKASSFRLVSATNQDLAKMVQEKHMRADFFYRVNVLAITVPPLRERQEDIPLLVDAYMEHKQKQFSLPLKIRMLMERYAWPGNVRELHNFLDRYATFGEVVAQELSPNKQIESFLSDIDLRKTLDEATLELEDRMIKQALEQNRWRRCDAAEQLGITVRTLQRKMKRLGMQ